MVNVANVRATLEFVHAHRDHWDQYTWAERDEDGRLPAASLDVATCGTTFCFAGAAALLAGDPPAFERGDHQTEYTRSGRPISTVAREFLDLTQREADALFLSMSEDFDVFAQHVREVTELGYESDD